MPRPKYDISAQWDDPYDRPVDRRRAPRAPASFELKIKKSVGRKALVGPARAENISMTGMWCLTKHKLEVGNRVEIKIPTSMCPSQMALPKYFMGWAEVRRQESLDDSRSKVGLSFPDAVSEDISFALFVDYFHMIGGLQTST